MATVTPSPAALRPSWRQQSFPSLEASDQEVIAWFDRNVNPISPRRRYQTQRCALNLWFYLGRQWIEPRAELAAGNGSYHFAEVYRNSNATFQRPVTNIIAPAVDNEVSRLSKKEYVPDTSAGKNDSDWLAAARLAKDIVKWEMSKQMWEAKREQVCFNLCLDSVVGLRTWWDENDIEVTLVSAPDPRICPACGAKFASAKIPRNLIVASRFPFQHTETLAEVPQTGEATAVYPKGIEMVEMRLCPLHPEPVELKPYEISEEEALQGDVFDRPMGLLVPRGDGMIDVVSVHEYFPENAGIGIEPHEQRLNQLLTVKPLEWLALRFPELEPFLQPEQAQQLLRVHPLYSEPSLLGLNLYGQTASAGMEVYSNHAFFRELTIQPQPHIAGLERGAYFGYACGHIVRRELCVEVEGEDGVHLIPRMKYHWARFRRLPKLFYSRSFVDDLLPLQRRLNEIDAQWVDLRERGKPNIWIPQGTEIRQREDSEGGSLEVIEYDSSMTGWDPRSAIFPGVPLTGTAYAQERATIMTDAQLIGAAQDIEMGQAPGSVKTTSGLMLLSEESSQKRGPRERGLVSMYEGGFEHILQLNYAFRKEEQAYEVVTEGGIYEQKSYTGSDLLGTIKVKMSARAGYDETLYNKEATAEAINLQLYRLDTPAAIDRALENMKLPKDVNQKQTLQIQRAEMAWSDFIRSRKVLVIDPTIFDAAAWYSILSQRWMEDECYAIQQSGRWDETLPLLANWELRKVEMEQQDMQQKQIYGPFPPEQWPQRYQEGQQIRAQAMAAIEAMKQTTQQFQAEAGPEAQAMAPPPPQLPEPPPIPPPPLEGFLPEQLELRIYAIWMRMLPGLKAGLLALQAAHGVRAPLDSRLKSVKDLDDLLRMRAVIEAFRLMLTGQASPPVPPPAGGAPMPGGPAPAPAGAPPAGPPSPGPGTPPPAA